MANAVYGLAREKFLNGDIDWAAHDIKAVLVDTNDYTVSINTDDFLDDVPVGARVATSSNFTGKTSTLGVADADNITFSLVSGDPSEALVIYRDTGVAATSPLIAYIDSATGLVVTPGGGDILVEWDDGANKIFKL